MTRVDYFQIGAGVSWIGLLAMFAIMLATHSCAACQLGEVTLGLIDGSTVEGTLEGIDETGALLGQGLPSDCRIDQVASIKTRVKKSSSQSRDIQIRLTGGGFVYADRVKIADDEIRLERNSSEDLMPLELVQAVVWRATEKTGDQIQDRSSETDTVAVQTESGERLIQGVLEGVDETHVRIVFKGESRKISKSKVNALILADLQMPVPEGVLATVQTTDHGVVVGAVKNMKDGFLNVSLIAGLPVSIPCKDVMSIEIKSDRVVFLSDLEPVDIQQKPIFSVPRSWRRDRSIEGNPLTLRDPSSGELTVFSKGLGTQSFMALTFQNTGDFDLFHATIGIDAETQGKGDCEMAIQGDGIQLWSRRVLASDKPGTISIDISGMKEIVLLVRPGKQFDLADHANWCEARFMKSQ